MKRRIFAVIGVVCVLFTCLLPFSVYADGSIDLADHTRYRLDGVSGFYSNGLTDMGCGLDKTAGLNTFPTKFCAYVNAYNPIDLTIESGSSLSFSIVFMICSEEVADGSGSTSDRPQKYYFEPSSDNVSLAFGDRTLVYGQDFNIEDTTGSVDYPNWYAGYYIPKPQTFRIFGEISEFSADNALIFNFDYTGVDTALESTMLFSANYAEISIVPPPPPNPVQTLMESLTSFSSGILGIWQAVVGFVMANGNEIALIGVFAWLFITGVGSIRRMVTGI